MVIEISSLTRDRIAVAYECFEEHASKRAVKVDFVVTWRRSSVPENASSRTPMPAQCCRHCGLVAVPWAPRRPVMGRGYEENEALGAVELLQVPEAVWTFLPNRP